MSTITEVPDSNKVFVDDVFEKANSAAVDKWKRLPELYPKKVGQPLLPNTLSREQFSQGEHYECFMLSMFATLVRHPDILRNCFVTKRVRQDGRYTFQFFRGREWVKVEIDDRVAMEDNEILFCHSPTKEWWPLLLEKAYAKFYTAYDHIEGCTAQETLHDLTGNPVLNIPMEVKLAKAAGADVLEGHWWLDLASRIQSGDFVAAVLVKDMDVENMGLQREQQYGVLEIFSLTGTSAVNDIVVHLHNPFEDEEFLYKGPLNSKDSTWTPKLRAKYDVDDTHSIFLPLNTVLKIMYSIQLCYIAPIISDATYYHDEWKGETSGGNPTSVCWRKNPLYLVRNMGTIPADIVVLVKQEDQRRFTACGDPTKYVQCGMVLSNYVYPNPIPTFWTTGNNHKPIHKSLFLNCREVASGMTIPPNSLCYLVPSTMYKGTEGKFDLALYRKKGADYSEIVIEKLSIPQMNWANPAVKNIELRQKEKDRVDFYVDESTDIHILMHQTKPFKSSSGGDAMTEDYMGMYLYDDTDHKIGGVHAATNFREISIIHRLPRSGRFAVSVTCPRAKGDVPAYITIVGSLKANARIVDPPEDATMFDDEDIIEEENTVGESNPIDYVPILLPVDKNEEVPDSNTPFEDRRFLIDNKAVTKDPWIHIGDLYPEGKNKPLLPDTLSRGDFEQGDHYECCCLTAFATLVDTHPDVIRNLFISKTPRKDGRYTFQFHRYGQWVKVEIDDRIPQVEGATLYCRSPKRLWWPLLLEKAYAKFYTLYQNLEGCNLHEIYHDFTGRPVVTVPTDVALANAALFDIETPEFWLDLNKKNREVALGGLTKVDMAEPLGMQDDQSYGILGFVNTKNSEDVDLSDILVKIYNPFEESRYTGPMNKDDPNWPKDMKQICAPEQKNIIYMPVDVFCDVFLNMQEAFVKGPLEPCWNFNSEWGDGTNGGNPTLVTWRENPLYVVRNVNEEPVQIIAMIRQPDQRHTLHRQTNQELNYIQCGLILSESTTPNPIPTYLVTGNNHRTVHKGLFLNSREVANFVTIPASSMTYLVPSAMSHDKGKFILSYWYLNKGDKDDVSLVRLQPKVARHLPAIDHIELQDKEKDRVDFLVDVPTEVHILLRQEKPFKTPNGGDAMAEDFLAMYLYDSNDKRITGTRAATNFRDIGLVQKCDKAGRYALAVTCPRGNGKVPCKVEVVAMEAAHVRITDPPENARELGEVDLAFLKDDPQGVPLADLPLDDDEKFQADLEELKALSKDPKKNADAIAALERQLNDRADALAKVVLGKDREKYLEGHDLEKLNPYLNENEEFLAVERERYGLKKQPKNAEKVRVAEVKLRGLADETAEMVNNNDLGFLDPEYEGIPTSEIPLQSDPNFSKLLQSRGLLMRDPATNARSIAELEDNMDERARQMAKDMHKAERGFLDPEPEGVPLELLPLNEDETFNTLESQLRAETRKPKPDQKVVNKLKDDLNDRAQELADKLKNTERDMFLDPQPLGVPLSELPLDTDPEFHEKEVERLRLRKQDPAKNQARIKELEADLNDRARELARKNQQALRSFLDQEPYGIPLEKLNLDNNPEYMKLEDELRALQKNPKENAKKIQDKEDEMQALVNAIAAAAAQKDRAFLDPEPEGRLVQSLPLDADKNFTDLDKKRRVLKDQGKDPEALADLEDKMNDLAHGMALGLNKKERPDFLKPTFKGIPHEDLPLDKDVEYRQLEAKRQQLKRDPKRYEASVAGTEEALNARALKLAGDMLAADRGYLDPEPEGVPLRFVPIDSDPTFQAMEADRAALKKDPRKNAKEIANLEGELDDQAHNLAQKLKEDERAKFLNAKPGGIPYAELPLDRDKQFRDMEIQRICLSEDPQKNAAAIRKLEDGLNERAAELAAEKKEAEREFLDPAPLGVPLAELNLDNNPEFVAKEAQLRALRKDPRTNANAIAALEDQLNDMAKALAAEELAKNRGFLDPEPEGRLLEELPLNTDPKFRSLEGEYRELNKDPTRNAQKLADLEELMNERAHELAKQLNATERPKFMNANPRGIPLEQLPLNTDEEFGKLEAERAKLMRNPAKNKNAIQDLEDAMNQRADELAQEKIQGDREFLDPEPENIPIKYLPLDEDPEFQKMEAERTQMKARNIAPTDPKRKEIEDAMNKRAHELAAIQKQKVRGTVLPVAPGGVPRAALPLDDDMPYNDLEVAHIKALGDGEPEKAQDLADAMTKRAVDVASKLRAEERANMGAPMGFSLNELPVDDDPEYLKKEAELCELRADPQRNAAKIAETEQALMDIATLMAREKAAEERQVYLDPEPEGRRVEDLPLDNDQMYTGLEEQYRKLKKDPYADEEKLVDLEQLMNDRAHELARLKNAEDRSKYLDPNPRNVPLSELPLDTDEQFQDLEAKRAKLCQDPAHNAREIKAVEDQLNDRADELAAEALKHDRIFLDDEPENVLQRQVDLDGDKEFQELEQRRAALKSNPNAKPEEIRALEDKMNDRLHVMAKEVKEAARNDMKPEMLGIPIADLGKKLDEDPHFHDLEEKYRDARNDPTKPKIAAQLLEQMNERARELAEDVHDDERFDLEQNPEGIPLGVLPLNEDEEFLALESEARALRNEPNGKEKNADRIAAIMDALDDRAVELANELRKGYCDAAPEGVPLELLKLGDDPAFTDKEVELRKLEKNPVANRQRIQDLKGELNAMAHQKAKKMLENDRDYLDPEPEGVALRHIPLSEDEKFKIMETERAKLKAEDPVKNADKIKDLEGQLNDRAHELAAEVKDNELRALDPDPLGVPYSTLSAHEDPQFKDLAEQLRELKADPRRNGNAIRETKDKMNARGMELAEGKLKDDRGYLAQNPGDVPLEVLPLDADPQFKKLEVERAKLKARDPERFAKKIEDLEAQLNDRALELAKEQKKEDLRGLDANPEGIAIADVDPHRDPEFAAMVNELRALKADAQSDPNEIRALQSKMNDRAHELAQDKLKNDRDYLDSNPAGVPASLLPLDSDPQFHELEAQRATLKAKDPHRNAKKIQDLEQRLNDRALELAEEQKKKDVENLDQEPEGIPIAVLDPHRDPEFAKMVDEHRELSKDPERNAVLLSDLEEAMNQRAHELAKDMLENDRGFLDKEPQGVPLKDLPLNTDEEFRALEAERAKLKALDPRRNAKKIKDLEDKLNNRAHELAREVKEEDLKAVDAAPRGIPRELLNLHEDPEFAQMAQNARSTSRDPGALEAQPRGLQDALNARANQIAADVMNRNYLDQAPEGVPLDILPLDTDPQFHELEVERAKLKLKDPKRNAKKIEDLEHQLADRARELAKEQLKQDLAACDPAPRGIPLELLKPHEDPEIAALIPQLRALRTDPVNNSGGIRDLEEKINAHVDRLAEALLGGDREYLDPKPSGVPLKYLPLESDPEFAEMEKERAKLKAEDPRRNQRKIKDLEDKLNKRAAELADEKKKEELANFPRLYAGVTAEALKPYDDKEFANLVDQLRQLEKAGKTKDPEYDEILNELNERLNEIAMEKKDGDLWFLDKDPEGIPVEDIPLSSDPTFEDMRKERAKLKAEDPRGNAAKIKELEGDMNERAHQLAADMKQDDFEGVDQQPRGIPLALLNPRDDPQVARILPELRRAKKNPRDAAKAKDLLQQLNDRVDELAKQAVEGDRDTYLDANPEGVPLDDIPLDQDGVYTGLEAERAKLNLEDPVGNAKQIEDLEDRLNQRAHELAQQVQKDDLKDLEAAPRGVNIEVLKPHDNPDFNELAKTARELKKDPQRNAKKLQEVEDKMNALADQMAEDLLNGDRAFLDDEPEGIPITALPLDEDPEFHDLEVKRATLKTQDPVKNKQAIADLEGKLNDRAHELAALQKLKDLEGLTPAPLGVPTELLNPHDDEKFASYLPELRNLKKDPVKNADKINALQAKLDGILNDMAKDYLDGDRGAYLEAAPHGVPLAALGLSEDPEFKNLENERLDLIAKNPRANKDAIADLEAALNDRAQELAQEARRKDRGFLDENPEGIPLDCLPLDTDRQFEDLEGRRAVLKARDPVKNAAAIRDLEDQLNERAHELALDQIAEDLAGLSPEPEDINIELLKPHADPEFDRMVKALRSLKADPDADPAKIEALEEDMNDRVHELAEEALKGDRPDYLPAEIGGVPIDALPLDEDPLFHQMEVERAKLKLEDPKKNAAKIADLEERLGDRAAELAEEQQKMDLDGLEQAPRGIPLSLLKPHQDATFANLAAQTRAAPSENKSRDINLGGAPDPTKEAMNDRLRQMAQEMLEGDRGYLAPFPEGVPLRALPLDDDEDFHNMEVQRAVLKAQDPRKNADAIKDLEDRLNDRAAELAREALGGDRDYLDDAPAGVPLSDLPLDTDPKFHQLEVDRAKLKADDPSKNAQMIADIEDKLNDRALELAEEQKKKDLEGLDANPRGIPLESLNPHEDEEFCSYLPELRKLKKDPIKNAARINDIEGMLDQRADELAQDQIAKDRAFLDQEPEGVPLAQLNLDQDKPFTDLEKQLRAAKRDPRRNADKIKDLEDKLNDRAHELAKDKLQNDRAYLDPNPEGVPLTDVPIDADPTFRDLEAQRAKLKAENPSKNADAIKDLEGQLNDRAHELAAEKKEKDRAFLNPTSHGIPKEKLPLDEDPNFKKMEAQLRKLQKDPRRNAPAIENLQQMMQDRADELGEKMLQGARDEYLDPNPEGVPLTDIALNDDPTYNQMELERALLAAEDPVKNADKIKELEGQLNDRAHELAAGKKNNDRAFLDPEPEGIPIEDVPLDDDPNFTRMEDYLRKLKKDPRRNAQAIADTEDKLNDRAHELAKGVVADDLAQLPRDAYRGIPKEDLNLHSYPKFREAANRARRARKMGTKPPDMVSLIEEMDAAASEIADDVIDNERAFLDKEPEGMDVKDLDLDNDKEFAALEADCRRRSKDPRSAKRNKDIIRDLHDKMNDRVHDMAKDAFAKQRAFMDQEPEGVPLAKLPLDTDPVFKDAEIARYKEKKKPDADPNVIADLEKKMNDRAHELAKAAVDKDRAFLDPEPEGVPLDRLQLASDPAFNELAKQRQALKNAGKTRDPAMKDLEAKMNDRAVELAKDYLNNNRDYLDPEPLNVPLADLPLNRDPLFREMENELQQLKKDPKKNAEKIVELQDELNDRANEIARDMLARERAMQNQEPQGVPLADLPLNDDPVLNQLERKRRDLKKDPKKNAEALKKLEPEIAARVDEIAKDFLAKERAFLDQEPEGVPLDRLPLSDDRDFHEMEKDLRELKKQPAKNKAAIEDLEERMNDRVHELAKAQLAKDRDFLKPDPLGIPTEELPLNEDPVFRDLEDQRRALKEQDPRNNAKAIKDLEDQLNKRAEDLAKEKQDKERAFLDQKPEGIPLKDIPLDKDPKFTDMEKQLRKLKKDPKKNADAIKDLEEDMNDRAHTLAKRQLADDRNFLNPEPRGVPIVDLDLDNDDEFRNLEVKRHQMKKDGADNDTIRDLEQKLNERAEQVAADFLKKDREYLDPEPEGVPLDQLPLNEDPDFHGMEVDRRKLKKDPNNNAGTIKDLEDKLNKRAHELALEKKGYQDEEFHAENENIAEEWPRLRELYPEGVYDPVVPEKTLPGDASSAPNDMGFLAPFIAALARHPVLIQRLFQDKAHPQNQPYRITLFNPDSSATTVEVDDRVPCDPQKEPKFTRTPSRMWYPLLLEKAYAKFVGGYENFNNCNAHDTLRDLTGRPVLHISLEDPKHAAATNMGDFSTPDFWRRVITDISRGDVFVCVANSDVPNGLHPQCSYALLDVVETVKGTSDPQDIVIKVHNCYTDEPCYNGPLRNGDSNWTKETKKACGYSADETDVIYMPLPTFLENFSCMQRCHINCGDRLSSPGEWNEYTSGGTSKYSTFRSNPIYLVQNKTSRPATILAEVRHKDPLYVDGNKCKRYPYTGLALMQPINAKLPPTPFITNGTHRFLQKGMMLDSREVCSEMVLPPSATCYLIPYTKDRGTDGAFNVSIYPDMSKVTLTPLRHAGLGLKPLHEDLTIETDDPTIRRDFMINEGCDVHILLHETKITDPNSVRKGDAVGEDEITIAAYNEYGIKVGSTGEPSTAREHALVFKAPNSGRYSVTVSYTGTTTSGPCTASLDVFTPPSVETDWVAVPADAKPLNPQSTSRFPALNRTSTAPSRGASRERGLSRDRNGSSARRTDSLPALAQRSNSGARRSSMALEGGNGRRKSVGRR